MKSLSQTINESNINYQDEISLNESYQMIYEKLITLGKKAYPKFGNIVIMAGGTGSGKGFIKDKLLGLEGKTFDVDALKELSLKSKLINKKAKKEFGVDLSKLNLKDPSNVGTLHDIIGGFMNLPKKSMGAMFSSILSSNADRKPNLIFDVTLKDISKLDSIARNAEKIGYKKENIHIVWVINDIEVAKKQNQERSRVVSNDILLSTHQGVALTMSNIINNVVDISKYMNGDIWFVFNKRGVDSKLNFSKNTKGAFSVEDAEMVLIKSKGSKIDKSKLTDKVVNKIISYVPKIDVNF